MDRINYFSQERIQIKNIDREKNPTNNQDKWYQPNQSAISRLVLSRIYYSQRTVLINDQIAFNTFPNKPWFLHVCSTGLLKTPCKKENLLVTSNFFFFHSVFFPCGELSAIFFKIKIVVCKLFQFRIVQNLSFGK